MSVVTTSVRLSSTDGISLTALRRYFAVIIPANLVWEFAHMPLYTIWNEGTWGEIVFAAVHCTGGDILIAMSALMLALMLSGRGWPLVASTRRSVTVLTVVFGLGHTLFSEWLNIVIRAAWAYSDLMPIIPVLDAGLSPVLQWIVVPLVAFWWAVWPFSTERDV
ncbi:hypothetical protein EGN72_03290 [Pseudorhodobacter sp. E13]|uniref:hypothetical protein n=1 Tax=Pseudorhodobacter sp. E13 TaxID=2487931 RepID=UPI000F8F3C65|nr:hypothetical protein [Pseudorhodobacter sp. E13]RUS63590.1 hypothetical protein EGN72_03290 [Pseudorhodobacter sp. E13]